jgi:uncharacterized glyoxalase superfamily protein PhnB
VYGIKTAVRRLEFAPESKEMEVADIATGRFVFRPRPSKPVSLSKLRKEIKNAGYEISGTRIEVAGALTDDGRLRVPDTGQVFRLEGEEKVRELRAKAAPDGTVTAEGVWATKDGEEVVRLEEARP